MEKRPLIVLERWCYHEYGGVFGDLRIMGTDFSCATLELEWQNNQVNISCIPVGIYSIRLGTFKGRYANYELEDVPWRTAVEMHRANSIRDLLGCIGLGERARIDEINNKFWINRSKDTFEEFMAAMDGAAKAWLVIVNRSDTIT